MSEIFKNRYAKFICLSFVPVVASTLLYVISRHSFSWLMIIWNNFLAVLPLIFALLAKKAYESRKKPAFIILSALWLLFFPNAPYMITDIKYSCMFSEGIYMDYFANGENIFAWFLVINLALCVFIGLLHGMMSLHIMHEIVKKRFGNGVGVAAVGVTIVLSSFAIYIGRFPRLNSWDVLRPVFLLEKIAGSVTEFMPVFILMFSFAIAFFYVLYYYFVKYFLNKK